MRNLTIQPLTEPNTTPKESNKAAIALVKPSQGRLNHKPNPISNREITISWDWEKLILRPGLLVGIGVRLTLADSTFFDLTSDLTRDKDSSSIFALPFSGSTISGLILEAESDLSFILINHLNNISSIILKRS